MQYFNLIGRESERSLFSWKSLFAFFQRIFFNGEVRIPIAVILGTSEFTFNPLNESDEERIVDDMVKTGATIEVIENDSDSNVGMFSTTIKDTGRPQMALKRYKRRRLFVSHFIVMILNCHYRRSIFSYFQKL